MSTAEPSKESVLHLMQTPLTDIPHLMQTPLTDKDMSILAGLQAWLSTAKFGDTDSGGKICIDEKLSEKWDLLCTMDFVQKFSRPLPQIIRVPALSRSMIINPKEKAPPNATDPVSITPMRTLQGNPTVSGQNIERVKRVLPFVVGSTTYIREEVEVMPALDLLIVASQPVGKGGEDRVAP